MRSSEPAWGVLGQDRWKEYFERAYAQQRLAHAYLLCGPEGVGKGTFARALGKRIVCSVSPGLADPCGACGPCKRFEAGTHPDVSFIDALAEGERGLGAEEARDRIVGAFRLRPHESPLRIVVVHDAERMEPAAQNALLKTLEEPPPRSLLLLLAREAGALLETVVSRCFLLRFSPVTEAELGAWLTARGTPPEEAARLASLCEGIPGRAAEWASDRVGNMDAPAAALVRGDGDPLTIGAALDAHAAELSATSAFERRRQAALALCAAVARSARKQLEAEPDARGATRALERAVAAAEELQGSLTPELSVDRLALDLAPPREPLRRPRS